MRGNRTYWAILVLCAVAVLAMGCSLLKREKKTETPISVETPTTTPAEGTAAPVAPPTPGAAFTPTKLDTLKMLVGTLYASAETLGWDNVFCSIALEKDVELFTSLRQFYGAGTADRNFVDASITDLSNIKTFVDEKVSKGEGIDPNGADAQAKKKKILDIRAKVQAMIAGPAPKEKIPEWKGDLMKKKLYESDEMKKKKWAERGKK